MTDTLEVAVPKARPVPERSSTAVAWLYGCTAFTGAALLFMVQPMVAKLLLPSYGGSATVWSTSALFFQVLLLTGYLYTHLTTERLGRRTQPAVHMVVLLLPLAVLPLALPHSAVPEAGSSPALWLLRTLTVMVALPFLVISTSGPLLQRWYSWTGQRRSGDPYFLFAASNLGSFGGLLAYPLAVEPALTLAQQRQLWSGAYVVFLVLVLMCGFVAMGRRSGIVGLPVPSAPSVPSLKVRVAPRTVLLWTALAFLPSTLMLGVTSHISTDVAPIPLLWVVPLAIYLATFVAALARTTRRAPVLATRGAIAVAVVAAAVWPVAGSLPIVLVVTVDLVLLTLVGFAAHGRLAADRPPPEKLTLFFLVVAVGGALGGLLNGLVAPMLFDRVWEYPIALAAVPLLLVGKVKPSEGWLARRYHPAFVGLLVVATTVTGILASAVGLSGGVLLTGAALAALLAGGCVVARRPGWLALGLVLAFATLTALAAGSTSEHTRTFFGAYSIRDTDGQRTLVHGNTQHGMQYLDMRSTEPTGYYAAQEPLGDVFRSAEFNKVGVIGLGTGTMAAWGRTGQAMRFYEIDSEIVDLARDRDLFTYLHDSAADIEVATGDGRLLIAREPDASYDLIVLDAFNSDAVPVHLLTREAMRGYARKLTRDGLLVVHISNRVFDLEPVVAAAAEALGWRAAVGDGPRSQWVVLSPDPARVDAFEALALWQPVDMDHQVAWTDDYSSVLNVLR